MFRKSFWFCFIHLSKIIAHQSPPSSKNTSKRVYQNCLFFRLQGKKENSWLFSFAWLDHKINSLNWFGYNRTTTTWSRRRNMVECQVFFVTIICKQIFIPFCVGVGCCCCFYCGLLFIIIVIIGSILNMQTWTLANNWKSRRNNIFILMLSALPHSFSRSSWTFPWDRRIFPNTKPNANSSYISFLFDLAGIFIRFTFSTIHLLSRAVGQFMVAPRIPPSPSSS